MCRCRKAAASGFAGCSRRCGPSASSRRSADSDKWIGVGEPYSFLFETCADAVAAYRERLPKMTELAKAMAIAKLETDGEYNEARHDAFFADFGDNGLDADDIAAFPDYLICLRSADFRAAESDLILRAFLAGMPAKLVVQTDDLLEQSPIRDEYPDCGLARPAARQHGDRGWRDLCVAVEQRQSVPAARPGAARIGLSRSGAVQRFLRCKRQQSSALSGGRRGHGIPGVSRRSPTIRRREPIGHRDSRFTPTTRSISIGRCSGSTMRTRKPSRYRKPLPSRWSTSRPDDPRCAKYFAQVPRAKWTADLVPVSEFLTRERKDLTEKVPCLLMVDGDNRLQKVIVNDALVREARRCVDAWRSLQELGGIHNSHAAKLVEQERKIWAEKAQAAAAVVSQQTSAAVAAPAAAPAAPCCRARRRRSGAGTVAGRGLYRDRPLHELQRVHAD